MKYLLNGLAMGAVLWATIAVSVAQDRGDIFPFPVTTFQLENGLQVVGFFFYITLTRKTTILGVNPFKKFFVLNLKNWKN